MKRLYFFLLAVFILLIQVSVSAQRDTSSQTSSISYKSQGYFGQVQFVGSKTGGLHLINGIKIGKSGMLGIGTGINAVTFGKYAMQSGEKAFVAASIPLFLYHEIQPLPTKFSPFFATKVGYAFSLDQSVHSNPITLLRYPSRRGVGLKGAVFGEWAIGVNMRTKTKFNLGLAALVGWQLSLVNYYNFDTPIVHPNRGWYKVGQDVEFTLNPGLRLSMGF